MKTEEQAGREFALPRGVLAVEVGNLFFHIDYPIICVRTDDTDDGRPTSAVALHRGGDGRWHKVATHCVANSEVALHQSLVDWLNAD